jgi:Arc/MetJ-type ribon-helix-helix transcriptional regulator
MHYQFPPDVEKLVRTHMESGGYSSEDDVLRDALSALSHFSQTREEADEERRQAIAAVREGTADVEAGRVTPLRSLIDQARRKPTERE